MAAALIAALFAMGVFSASGVGAQSEGPTATARLVDPADLTAATTDTATASKADDTLVITFSGLTRQAGNASNAITVTMEDALGTPGAPTWKGGSQFEDVLTAPTYTGGTNYPITITGQIEAGTAVLEIPTATNTIDSNTMITALTIGRTDAMQTVTNVPISITGAPDGPSISLAPISTLVDTEADVTMPSGFVVVTVTGANFGTGDVTFAAAFTADDGTSTTVDINGFNDATPPVRETAGITVAAADVSNGAFETMIYIPKNVARTITVTATQGTDTSMAMFVVNRAPTVSTDEDAVFFESEGASDQTVMVTPADPDGHELTITVVSSDEDVATVDFDMEDNEITVSPMGPGTAEVTVTVDDGYDGGEVTATFDVTVLGVVSSSDKADADVVLEIIGRAENRIRGGRDIVVGLPGYFIPDGGIHENDVIINGVAEGSYYGNPSDVSVSGSNVTITVPARDVNTTGGRDEATIEAGGYVIRFKDGAGLRNPNSAGNKTVTVSDADATDHELPVSIISHISVKPGWVSRGDTFTITGKGINANGDTTAHLYTGNRDPEDLQNERDLVESRDSIVLGRNARDGGTVIVEDISTSRSDFEAEATDAVDDDPGPAKDAQGTNLIVMVDAAGDIVGYTYLGLLPNVELDVTDVRRTGEVVVTVSDWYYGSHIDRVRINGIEVNLPDGNDDGNEPDPWGNNRESVDSDGDAKFTVVVDRNTRLGEMQVDLRGYNSYLKQGSASSPDIHKQTVQVGFFPLTITPSTAVTEQVIQIEGEEFLARTCITRIMVGERSIEEATNGDRVSADSRDCVDTDGNGKLTATFKVPRGLNPGTYSVEVRDNGNRVGEAKLEIPKPTITLDPTTSQRGSTVVVVGDNFPADDVVTISYRGITIEAAQTDTRGDFRATFTIPITAPIGATHEVVAASENKADGKLDPPQNQLEVILTAKAEHRVSDETLEFDRQQVAPGEQLGIIAGNLPLFNPVSISIGGRAVAGKVLGEENASDGFGNYIDSVLVPQLPPGFTIVELIVHTERGDDVRVSEFVEITNIVTRPTDEVFADLNAAGQVVVVWRYDNATQTWASYDFSPNVPADINDLKLVSTGDIVWIRVTEGTTFQGAPLFTGWNLRTLE